MRFIRFRGRIIPIGIGAKALPKLNMGMTGVAAKASMNHIEKVAQKSGVDLITSVTRNFPRIKVHTIIVPKQYRMRGVGSNIMEKISKVADKHKRYVTLDVAAKDTFTGTTSASRLIKFYRRFGFRPNVGRNADFRFNEYMVRKPKQ